METHTEVALDQLEVLIEVHHQEPLYFVLDLHLVTEVHELILNPFLFLVKPDCETSDFKHFLDEVLQKVRIVEREYLLKLILRAIIDVIHMILVQEDLDVFQEGS